MERRDESSRSRRKICTHDLNVKGSNEQNDIIIEVTDFDFTIYINDLDLVLQNIFFFVNGDIIDGHHLGIQVDAKTLQKIFFTLKC